MTLGEIKYEVMFQSNYDADDLGDFSPYIIDYINDGYDRLVEAWASVHTEYGKVEYPRMANDTDEPKLPEWTHRALADWATWLIYRNGNPQRQQRGLAYKTAFEEILAKIRSEGGKNAGGSRQFYHIPI